MSLAHSLMKIDVIDRQDLYLMCSYDEIKQHLRITVLDLDECKAYSGNATDIDLMRQAATIHMVFSDFISLTLKALTKSKHGDDKFLYCLEENCESFIFKWKSVDQEETIISIGSMQLTELPYKSMIKEVFALLSQEITIEKDKLALTIENLSILKKEMEISKQLLTDVNNVKERVENELYSKFTLLLNEKKEEMRNLKRKIDSTPIPNVNKRQKNTVKSRKPHQISDSSDEGVSEPDMDVDRPSTSKCNNSLLFFDDDEQKMIISPSKKRNRNHCTVPKIQEHPSSTKPAPQISESESEDELFKNL